MNRCLEKGWHDRVAIFLLIGFCGVRIEEAVQLEWKNISYEKKQVDVSAAIAKKSRYRLNDIPPNAMAWFEKIRDQRMTGPIIQKNWKGIIRSAIRFSHIDYKQNCIRHSFCSYALGAGWSIDRVILYMGHKGSPKMIHDNYRGMASTDASNEWWSILPPKS